MNWPRRSLRAFGRLAVRLGHLLRLTGGLTVHHLLAHKVRATLSVFGVASGVALAISVSSLSRSIDASLEEIAAGAASGANLEIRAAAPSGMPLEILYDIRSVPGVEEAGATVESYTKLRHGRRVTRALLVGIDPGIIRLSPRAVNPKILRSGDLSAVFLPASLARELRLEKKGEIEVSTPTGWRTASFTVVPEEFSGTKRMAFGGIGILQDLLGRLGKIDAIYVKARDPQTILPQLQSLVAERGRVGPPALRRTDIRQLLSQTTTILNAATLLALFVGTFLVYNTMSMAAVERIRESAILRAIGGSRSHVRALLLAEGLLLGALGILIGVGSGTLLSGRLLVAKGSALQEILPIEVTRSVLHVQDATLAGAAGLFVALIATLVPARRLSRAEPALILGSTGVLEDPTRSREPMVITATVATGSVLITIGLYSIFFGSTPTSALVGFTSWLLGVVLLIPNVVPALTALVTGRRIQHRFARRGLTQIAASEIRRSPGRTSFTVGALLLSLSLVVGFGIAQASLSRTFQTGFDEIIRGDLYVRSATWRPFGSDVPLDGSIIERLKQVPGVAAAYRFRLVTTLISGRAFVVEALDNESYSHLPALSPRSRRDAQALAQKLSQPDTVAISPSAERELGLRVGDLIDFPTPGGLVRLRVVDTLVDPSAISPTLNLDFETLSRLWGTNGVDSIGLALVPGASPAKVKAELLEGFKQLGITVDTREEYLDLVNGLLRAILGLLSSIQLVALLVAGLGVANTLLISTTLRRRDFGVLRAVGMLRMQVRRMVVLEALLMAGIGVVLAWGIGTTIGYAVYGSLKANLGTVEFVVPPSAYVAAAVLGLAVAAVAALYPAHRAAQMNVIDALQYE